MDDVWDGVFLHRGWTRVAAFGHVFQDGCVEASVGKVVDRAGGVFAGNFDVNVRKAAEINAGCGCNLIFEIALLIFFKLSYASWFTENF